MPFADLFVRACARRDAIVAAGTTSAYRLLDGTGDGVPGVYIDRYGPAAVLSVYDDSRWSNAVVTDAARAIQIGRAHV